MAIAALIVAASDRDISVYGWFPFHFLTLEQDRAVVYACWLVVKRTDERECESARFELGMQPRRILIMSATRSVLESAIGHPGR